jgi:hypothetical protein
VWAGYLLTWLGAVAGLIVGAIPGILLQGALRHEGFVFGFVFGWIFPLLIFGGAIAGTIGVTYLFLRQARLPAAGRTASLLLPVWITAWVVVAILDAIVGSGPIIDVVRSIYWIAAVCAPALARRLALRSVGVPPRETTRSTGDV